MNIVAVLGLLLTSSETAVESFTISSVVRSNSACSIGLCRDAKLSITTPTTTTTTQLLSQNKNNNDNGDDDRKNSPLKWAAKRVKKADPFGIRRDVILCAAFVFGRFWIYEMFHSYSTEFGMQDIGMQNVVYLSGTLSSASVLAIYWTIAGYLTLGFETRSKNSDYNPLQILVNVAVCCPVWIATEHALRFGPSDIGGATLGVSIVTGFAGLGSAMLLGRFAFAKVSK